jgi:hypothetical protein
MWAWTPWYYLLSWTLWKERNTRVFRGMATNAAETASRAISEGKEWVGRRLLESGRGALVALLTNEPATAAADVATLIAI